MTNASLDRSVRLAEDVVFRELEGETVILNLESGTYFGLDPVGTRIWQLCQEHGSLRLVWQVMQDEFEASADDLQADLLSFIDELSAKGLVRFEIGKSGED
jgi:hypothetical protein